jgi:hypothetical protein
MAGGASDTKRQWGLCSGLALIVGAAPLWSSRPLAAVDMETLDPPPEFASLLDKRPGDVLWIDGKSEAWQMLRRPQWVSLSQSVSAVFSRQLGMAWRERAQFLLDNGLIVSNAFAPWKPADESVILNDTSGHCSVMRTSRCTRGGHIPPRNGTATEAGHPSGDLELAAHPLRNGRK